MHHMGYQTFAGVCRLYIVNLILQLTWARIVLCLMVCMNSVNYQLEDPSVMLLALTTL